MEDVGVCGACTAHLLDKGACMNCTGVMGFRVVATGRGVAPLGHKAGFAHLGSLHLTQNHIHKYSTTMTQLILRQAVGCSKERSSTSTTKEW